MTEAKTAAYGFPLTTCCDPKPKTKIEIVISMDLITICSKVLLYIYRKHSINSRTRITRAGCVFEGFSIRK